MRDKTYKQIKIIGMISFIPMILAAGPLMGYIVGDYLKNKFKFSDYALYILILLGFIAAIIETVRIIKLVNRIR